MTDRSKIAYIGLSSEGTLAMFFTEYPCSPVGSRLLRAGQRFPDSVHTIYSEEELSREAVTESLVALGRFLNGEETISAAPVFGEGTNKPRRKKRTT